MSWRFKLNMRKNFFPLRVTEPWPRLPREAVESPSLEIFQPHLAAVLCRLLWVTLLRQGVGLDDPERSLPTPTILWKNSRVVPTVLLSPQPKSREASVKGCCFVALDWELVVIVVIATSYNGSTHYNTFHNLSANTLFSCEFIVSFCPSHIVSVHH